MNRTHQGIARHRGRGRAPGIVFILGVDRGLVAGLLILASVGASAAGDTPGLPPPGVALEALERSSAYQAALRNVDAGNAQDRQLRANPNDWVSTLTSNRRRIGEALSQVTAEWDILLERRVRLPGKYRAYERGGRSRIEEAQAGARLVWREQCRQLLDGIAAGLREVALQRVWSAQVALLERQLDIVTRRNRIGVVAQIEIQQAESAIAQARAQAEAAAGRAGLARDALARRFAHLPALEATTIPDPVPIDEGAVDWLGLQQQNSAELELARATAEAAAAFKQIESAEKRPDPSVGVRVGTARNGEERLIGVVLTVPIGGDYRSAGASLADARSAAAVAQLDEARHVADSEALRRLREGQIAFDYWQASARAADALDRVAAGQASAYALGEGSLTDVLAAQRLANEQRLLASLGMVDAWMARYHLEIEAGILWSAPASASASGVGAESESVLSSR